MLEIVKSSIIFYNSIFSVHQLQFFNNFSHTPFIYKVVTPQQNTHYVIGSIHVLKNEDHPLPMEFEKALNLAKVLVLETNISRTRKYNFAKIIQENCMLQDKTLNNLISKETFSKIKKYLQHRNSNINKYLKYKPWFLAMILSSFSKKSVGFKSSLGVDVFLAKKSLSQKKTIKNLETPDTVFKILNRMSLKNQEIFLLDSIGKKLRKLGSTSTLVRIWKSGNEFYLNKYLSKIRNISKGTKSFYTLLFDQRNINMTKNTLSYLKNKEPHLIVVGAGHLIGNYGLISTLRNLGYTVTRMRKLKW